MAIHVHINRKPKKPTFDSSNLKNLSLSEIRQALATSGAYTKGSDIKSARYVGESGNHCVYEISWDGPDGPGKGKIYLSERNGKPYAEF